MREARGRPPVSVNEEMAPRRRRREPLPERAAFTFPWGRGLWALDSNGVLQLLVREGDDLEVDGSVKTVKSFTVLTLVPRSPGQTRAFNDTRELVYQAQFTDGSQAIVRVHIP